MQVPGAAPGLSRFSYRGSGLAPTLARHEFESLPDPSAGRAGGHRPGAALALQPGFFRDAFANALTSAITLDVYLSALAFSAGVALDVAAGRRRWWALPATFLIGLSFALPGYLWWRLRARQAADGVSR